MTLEMVTKQVFLRREELSWMTILAQKGSFMLRLSVQFVVISNHMQNAYDEIMASVFWL